MISKLLDVHFAIANQVNHYGSLEPPPGLVGILVYFDCPQVGSGVFELVVEAGPRFIHIPVVARPEALPAIENSVTRESCGARRLYEKTLLFAHGFGAPKEKESRTGFDTGPYGTKFQAFPKELSNF